MYLLTLIFSGLFADFSQICIVLSITGNFLISSFGSKLSSEGSESEPSELSMLLQSILPLSSYK